MALDYDFTMTRSVDNMRCGKVDVLKHLSKNPQRQKQWILLHLQETVRGSIPGRNSSCLVLSCFSPRCEGCFCPANRNTPFPILFGVIAPLVVFVTACAASGTFRHWFFPQLILSNPEGGKARNRSVADVCGAVAVRRATRAMKHAGERIDKAVYCDRGLELSGGLLAIVHQGLVVPLPSWPSSPQTGGLSAGRGHGAEQYHYVALQAVILDAD
jgi:hypothetical protein